MSAIRGAAAGVLGLTLLQAIVSSDQATSNTGGLFTFVTNALTRWFNPYTPLIPDLRKPAAGGTTAAPTTPAPGLPQPPPGGHSQIIRPPGDVPRLPGAPDGQGGTVPPTTTPRSSLDQQPV